MFAYFISLPRDGSLSMAWPARQCASSFESKEPLRALIGAALLLMLACCGCRSLSSSLATSKDPAFVPPQLAENDPQSLSLAERLKPLKLFQPFEQKKPTNDKEWVPELSRLSWADYNGSQVTVHNIRNAEYYTYNDCVTEWYDKTFDLKDLQRVDFILVPFAESPSIAHTMLSFGLANGEQIGVSAEVRLEKGEKYDAALGLFGQFELIYLVADERDLIRSRVEHRDVDVYLYPTIATPEQTRRLFVDVMKRVNKLRDEPEFYDTLSNNCTTNIVRHINDLAPGKVPTDYRVLLPGFSDQLAYELGLIDNRLPYEELKRRCRVNDAALKYRDHPQFSAMIRRELGQSSQPAR